VRSASPSSRRQRTESAQQSLAVAGAKSTHQPRGKPRAPNLARHECGPIASGTTDEPRVLDDLPEMIPVTGPELDVIETYLGNLIDRLLMEPAADRAVAPTPTSNRGYPSGPPALDRD
jgi:hypothetical protein